VPCALCHRARLSLHIPQVQVLGIGKELRLKSGMNAESQNPDNPVRACPIKLVRKSNFEVMENGINRNK